MRDQSNEAAFFGGGIEIVPQNLGAGGQLTPFSGQDNPLVITNTFMGRNISMTANVGSTRHANQAAARAA